MVEWSAEQLAQRAFDLNLLDERQLQTVWNEVGARSVSVEEMKQALLRRELLSSFQLERLLKGEKTGYFCGDYKLVYGIGAGTFARVFRAVHRHTGRVVAVKVLRGRYAAEEPHRESFMREAGFGIALKHPNIVQIFEVAVSGGLCYMVMEFVEGRTLAEFLKTTGKFEPADAIKLMTDMAAGLDFAFQKGITHRDLKPSNVLISAQRQAKLADFGLASADPTITDEDLTAAVNPRTVDYAGLEYTTGVRRNDPRSDIYFLGCIYYHMLSGRPPLTETNDRMARLQKSRFLEVKPLLDVAPKVPRNLAGIITKAMELNPSSRYQRPAEMLADIKVIGRHVAEGRTETVEAEHTACLMIVESNTQLQNVLRDKLKQQGYKVLVTSDPDRPVSWFTSQKGRPADCVVYSTGELGEVALAGFNEFAIHPDTRDVPAILLLGEKQSDWKAQARLADHRIALSAPLRLKEFRETVEKVSRAAQQAATA